MLRPLLKCLDRGLEFLFPLPCPVCGACRSGTPPNSICPDCLARLNAFVPPYCPSCGGRLDGAVKICQRCLTQKAFPWQQAIALFPHENEARVLVHELKFRKKTVLARAVGQLAVARIDALPMRPEIIIPIPLHWTRRIRRTYNQAEEIARFIGEYTAIDCRAHALTRKRHTAEQSKADRARRLKNLRDAFAVSNPAEIAGKHVLLVDDVLTTGATLRAGTEILLQAGAAAVTVFAVNRR